MPAATLLKKKGANKGAISAFLISTPESGIDSIAISFALLDPIMTVLRPVAAFLTAIGAGFLENFIDWKKKEGPLPLNLSCPVDNCCDGTDCPPEVHARHHTLLDKVGAGLRFGLLEVWGDIVLWFFAGLLVAGGIVALIPDAFMERWLGGGFSSMVMMLVVGIPLYICASASTPVAAALILKGVSPGTALVFLLVGPATNITSLSVLMGILGKRSTLRYLFVVSVFAVCMGLGLDALYHFLGIVPRAVIGKAAESIPSSVKMAGALLLLGLSIRPVLIRIRKKIRRPPLNFRSGFPEMKSPH
ncbi:MAG: permease [Desulfocapsaceae bacterium]|nr:permease [Desulfocapsaceae bacterium]